MSAAAARARALPAAVPAAPPAPRSGSLRLVPQRRRARRAPFVAVVVALLAGGLLGLLALNSVLAKDAFHLHELKVEGRELADREQELLLEVERLQAPRAIADRAAGLGMVPGGPPSFLRLPDGAVLGVGGRAPAPAELVTEGQAAPADPAATQDTAGGTR